MAGNKGRGQNKGHGETRRSVNKMLNRNKGEIEVDNGNMGEGETMHMGKTGVEKTCGKGKTGSLREDKRVELKAKNWRPKG